VGLGVSYRSSSKLSAYNIRHEDEDNDLSWGRATEANSAQKKPLHSSLAGSSAFKKARESASSALSQKKGSRTGPTSPIKKKPSLNELYRA